MAQPGPLEGGPADTLGMAPALVDGRVPDADGDWVQRLHEFFGCRPYWVA